LFQGFDAAKHRLSTGSIKKQTSIAGQAETPVTQPAKRVKDVLLVETMFTTQRGLQLKIEELTKGDLETVDGSVEAEEVFPGWYASNLWHGKAVKNDHWWHKWLRDKL
jgi:hypothetical protein